MKRPGRRTGPKPRFTVAMTVAAAMRLGLDSFTLAQVAKELGVSTPSLYRVVASREELARLCLRHAAGCLQLPDPHATWPDQLRQFVDAMWGMLELFPGLARALLENPGSHTNVQGYIRKLTASLAAAGFPGDGQVVDFTLDFLADTTIMTHLSIMPMRAEISPGYTGLDQARDLLAAEAAASGGRTHFAAEDSWIRRGYLDAKVEFIIAGVAAGHGLQAR